MDLNDSNDAFAIPVLFEDAGMVVIDKPSGRPMNETHTSSMVSVIEQIQRTFPNARLVHRLDRDTSGVAIVAKNPIMAEQLSLLFRTRQIQKCYVALVEGEPTQPATYDSPIALDKKRPRARRVASDGQTAITHVSLLSTIDGISSVRAEPLTGRTHQIRVHLAHAGHPIVGDPLYGGPTALCLGNEIVRLERVMLHALSIKLVVDGRALSFSAPLPETFLPFVERGFRFEP